ncbi:MAG: hypothetical protein CSB16_01070 [Clostridiales bacterium]|nr:MAG: hypothetical protein CSB16_01070 [Clostridiales bacterium]
MAKRFILYLQVFATSFFWGISFVAITSTLEVIDYVEMLATRWSFAAITVIVLYFLGIIKLNYKNKGVFALVILSLFEPCLYSIFEVLGLMNTSASQTSLVLALIPVFVTIGYAYFFKVKIRITTILAIIVCLIGVSFTIVFEDGFTFSKDYLGYLYLLMAILSATGYVLSSAKLSVKFTPIEITSAMVFTGAIFFNVYAFIKKGSFDMYVKTFTNLHAFLGVAFLGIFCSVLCFLLYNNIVSKVPASIVSVLIGNSVMIVGVISGVIINGDSFSIYKFSGVVITLIGIIIVNLNSVNRSNKIYNNTFNYK